MQTFWQDLRYGARMLMKQPGFTLIAVLTLSLGIGANTAIFSVVNAVLLKPLPVTKPEELVTLYTSDFSGQPYGASSYPDYLDFRARADVLEGLLAYWGQSVMPVPKGANAREAQEPLQAEIVSGNYFAVLGVAPVRGRAFLSEEDSASGAHPVALLSYDCWQRRFGGDANLIGQSILLNNQSYTVIGIAPPAFTGLTRGVPTDVWLPMAMTPRLVSSEDMLNTRGARTMSLLGRLKPGVSLAQARAQFSLIAQQQRAAYPQHWTNLQGQTRSLTVLPESEARIPPQARNQALGVAGLILAVVGLVLAVACANLVGMLLARATTRRKEIAVRLALGATRRQLIRLLMSESLLLAGLGGALGLLVAWWTTDLLKSFLPPLGLNFNPDATVLLFTLVVALVTSLAFGLAPAMQATKLDLVGALKDESGTLRYRRSRLRSGLVMAQIAVSVLLLIGAGLLLRSLLKASAIDTGFNQQNLLLLDVQLQDTPQAQGFELFRQMQERLRALPGVRTVSLVDQAGLDFDGLRRSVTIEGYQPRSGEDMELYSNSVGPRYFQTMEIPLLRGRDFSEQDRAGAPGVVIINEALARRYFPGQEALGKRLSVTGAAGPWLEIIGIARDGKYISLFEQPQPFFSLPFMQHYQDGGTLLVRTESDPRHLLETARSEVLALDQNLHIWNVTTMTEHLGLALLPLRIGSLAAAIFGLVALLLASLGVYGVVAYFVGLQQREIGVRLALGARPGDILKLVLRQGLSITLSGIALGLLASFALTRVLASFLYGVSALDLLTFVGVAALLAGVALVACWIPARRATKVDPMIALRCE
ncbi:MAG TPA: ABC transporter permease [Blastocatellia bacterium]|nr:ABC transporter permease [Blastocatellia bacterium]